MKKVADGIYRQTTTRKTKSGVKTYTYYYEIAPAGSKRKYNRLPMYAARARTPLSQTEIDNIVDEIDDFVLSRQLLNQIIDRQENRLPVTSEWIENLLTDEKLSKQEQFIKNLGYSAEEFEELYGLTAEDLLRGTMTRSGNYVQIVSEDGEIYYFIWDYDKGLTAL